MKKNVFSDYSDFLDDDFQKLSKKKNKATSSTSKVSTIKKALSNVKKRTKSSVPSKNQYEYYDIDLFDFSSTTSKIGNVPKKTKHTKQKNFLKSFKFIKVLQTQKSQKTPKMPRASIRKNITDYDDFDFTINTSGSVTKTDSQNTNKNSSKHTNPQLYGGEKFHIVIDPSSGNYTLLDSYLSIVDSMDSNPLFSFFTQKYKLHKFKRQLKRDFKSYIKSCHKTNQVPDSKFKNMYKKTKYYLAICPDADYQILELLRNNVTKINHNYANYQTACTEYLYELAKYEDGNPDNMPFDINFCCNKINNKHSYIAYQFGPSPNPVQTFKTIYRQKNNVQSEYQSNIRYDSKVPNTKFSIVRKVRTPITHDDRI